MAAAAHQVQDLPESLQPGNVVKIYDALAKKIAQHPIGPPIE